MVRSNEDELEVMTRALRDRKDCYLILIGGLWRLVDHREYLILRHRGHLDRTYRSFVLYMDMKREFDKNQTFTEDFLLRKRAEAEHDKDRQEYEVLHGYEQAIQQTEDWLKACDLTPKVK